MIDGDYPSGRPISRILEKDGAMYFGTRTEKEMYRQLKQNPHVVSAKGSGSDSTGQPARFTTRTYVRSI